MAERPIYLRIDEVARLLRTTRATIYRRVREGSLESTRIAGPIRIPARAILGPGEEVPAWLNTEGGEK
jgi:excisionase family DNA binding protein